MFRQHLAHLMDGAECSFECHINSHRSHVSEAKHVCNVVTSSSSPTADPALLLSASALSARFASLKPKALGEAALGGGLFRCAHRSMATLYHPLTTKVVLSCTPPIQWVGGQ
eukprot:12349977-Karenia_brevis.AAC.1